MMRIITQLTLPKYYFYRNFAVCIIFMVLIGCRFDMKRCAKSAAGVYWNVLLV